MVPENPPRRKRRARRKIKPSDVRGLKCFRALAPLLERLHDVGTERDRAGNRRLHYDHYCLLILLYLFSPLVTSLRSIQRASELENVQKKLKLPRVSLGSLSEATDVFDPERLKEIIGDPTSLHAARNPLPQPRGRPPTHHSSAGLPLPLTPPSP